MISEAPGGVALKRIGEITVKYFWRDTLIDQIADVVGVEGLCVIMNRISQLVTNLRSNGTIQSEYSKIILLIQARVVRTRWVGRGINACQLIERRQPRLIREFIIGHSHTTDKAQFCRRVQLIREISKALALIDRVMNGRVAGSGGTQTQAGMEIEAGQIIAEPAIAPLKLETRLGGIVHASIHAECVAATVASVLGPDFDHARRTVTVLGRQHSIDQA